LPTVFASVSITLVLFFVATIAMAYAHLLPPGLHMLWGFFVALLIVLLQCLVFGFFIGSGKSIKRVVEENGLSRDWVQKTKDYKNQSYPMLMLAVCVSVAAAAVGGGVSVGSVPLWVHETLIWAALAVNLYSLWISYKVVVENVNAIHRINEEVRHLKSQGIKPPPVATLEKAPGPPPPSPPFTAAHFYFLAAAVWVPFLYMRVSLGSRSFPYWPFLVVSLLCLAAGWWRSRKAGKAS